MKTMNFKSKEAYRKWAAYGHKHGLFEAAEGNTKVLIRGKVHKVVHKKPVTSKAGRRQVVKKMLKPRLSCADRKMIWGK
jgi:hypothetical protein